MAQQPIQPPILTVDRPFTPEADQTGPYDPPTIPDQRRRDLPLPQISGYEITCEIARGGMGRVLSGRELALDREVAVKSLLPSASPERFLIESRVTAKLPHPNIPPVYALGFLEDGSPFLAMKLIRGKTLAEALSVRASSSLDLPRFVAIFEQICQAVGFAHSRGIIHRDLKPANVMIGAFGEVHVMDWGLARSVATDDSATVGDVGNGLAGAAQTRAGAVLGTPAYMAPEQARGDAVGPQADVFGLGGILAAILTGRPVFVEKSADDAIRRAAEGATDGILSALSASDADEELKRIAIDCLRPFPADRPPDGTVVADRMATYRANVDLRMRRAESDRVATEVRERESRKRRRVWMIGSSVTIAVLSAGIAATTWQVLVARRERNQKEEARRFEQDAKDRAVVAKNRAIRALDLSTDELVGDLLARKGRLSDKDREFLTAVMQNYEQYAEESGDIPPTDRADASRRVGTIRHLLGDYEAASRSFDSARRLLTDIPRTDRVRRLIIAIENNDALNSRRIKDFRGAASAYRRAVEVSREQEKEGALTDHERRNRVVTLGNQVQMLIELAEIPQAQAVQREIEELLDSAAHHRSADWVGRRAEWAYRNGLILRFHGKLPEAESALALAVRLGEQAVAADSEDRELRSGLAQSFMSLGGVINRLGKLTDAERAFRSAVRWLSDLSAEMPGAIQVRSDLGLAHLNLASGLRRQNKFEEAEKQYASAQSIFQPLADRPDCSAEDRQNLARAMMGVAVLYRQTSRPAEAEKSVRGAIAIFERICASHPDSIETWRESAIASSNLANLLRDGGRYREAENADRNASEAFHQVADRAPNQVDARIQSVASLTKVARSISRDPTRRTELRAVLDMMIDRIDAVRKDHPENDDAAFQAVIIMEQVGDYHLAGAAYAEAAIRYRAGLEICEKFDPKDLHTEYLRLATAVALAKQKRPPAEWEPAGKRAMSEIEDRAKEVTPDRHERVARAYEMIAEHYKDIGQSDESKQWLTKRNRWRPVPPKP